MDWNQYRKAVDELSFSSDFQERTMKLLHQRARELEKEPVKMKLSLTRKLAVAAVAAALLAVSVSAAVLLLSPAQVAQHYEQSALARAFEEENAIQLNKTVRTEDFTVTLMGLTSGAGLTDWQDVDVSHTYAVVALERLDGTPLENQSFDFIRYTLTPLVSGYTPWAVNNWTLHAFATGFAQDGIFYFLLDTQDLNMFADRTVYLAFYEGGAPSREIFTMDAEGAIAFQPDFEGPQALFILPLDESLADPTAAQAFVDSTGIDYTYIPDEELPEEDTSDEDIRFELLPSSEEKAG